MKTRTPAIARTWHVKAEAAGYAVYDPENRFRARFSTRAAADAYIADRSAARKRNAGRVPPCFPAA